MAENRPRIAIVGSARVDENEPDLSTVIPDKLADAQAACKALGKELAEQSCNIAVYSANPNFIEHFIIAGYLEADKKVPNSITAVYPTDSKEYDEFLKIIKDDTLIDNKGIPGAIGKYRSIPR